MIVWRISNHTSLSGDGALRASGRWHTRGRRVVYCAQSPSAALLEILVHAELSVADLPARYRLLKIDAPDDLKVERLSTDDLQGNWSDHLETTRAVGDAWLAGRRTALLIVPSAVIPATSNVLINPAHPGAARLVIAEVSDHVIDPRLLR